ncbi:MAG TPA: gephyrin-like molybdotransferase Glp [Actinomycetota bacterium]|nr:gephyrin-like molybdotransferase Glp [Actinomycetota bacterium]
MSPEPLLEVPIARERVLARFEPLDTLEVTLDYAVGMVVARDVAAPHDLPRFDNSAMDGFALRAADVAGASETSPAVLPLAGEVRAGGSAPMALGPGTATKIMTGAVVPDGADAVVPVELTEPSNADVRVLASVAPGEHIRPAGDDVHRGDVVIESGTELGSGEVALLASFGIARPLVHRRPLVALLVTGDELVDPDDEPAPNQIRDSNSVALRALVAEAGGEVVSYRRVADTRAAHLEAFGAAAEEADVIVSSGGVAVGDYDYVKDVVEQLGSIDLWRVAMQPGKPLVLGRIRDVPFLGLPGNPVSVHVGFEQFVRPALRKMRGCRELLRPTITARLNGPLSKRPGRLHLVRVRLTPDGSGWRATPTGAQGSHIQSSLVDCHGVARFERDFEHLDDGAEVVVEVWRLPGS